MSLKVILTCMIVFSLGLIATADATTIHHGKAIGIVIGKSCQMASSCLQYKDIINLDNSNQNFAGKFVLKNGDYSRLCNSTTAKNSWLDYTKNYTIIVDPCHNMARSIPLIEIVSSLDEYHLQGQMAITESGKPDTLKDSKATVKVRTFSKDRYVDDNCNGAIISGKKWRILLPDTINYLRSNCDASQTNVQTLGMEITPLLQHDVATSSKYKLEKFYDKVKLECTKKRNACTSIENKAITTMSDTK